MWVLVRVSWRSPLTPFLLIAAATSCSMAPGAFEGRADSGLAAVPSEKAALRSDLAGTEAASADAPAAADRMQVSTAQMAVQVPRPEEAIERFTAACEAWGGHLSARRDQTVTCRVPAEHFDAALEALRGYGPVLSQVIDVHDVTDEHVDLTIRLENARKARDRLLTLLDKADKVPDILAIEEQLRRLTEDIELLEGRLEQLADQVALSTITVTFQPAAAGVPQAHRNTVFPWLQIVGPEYVRSRF